METQTAERVRARKTAGPATAVACTGAAAFAIAGIWFWLATKGVTVAAAPRAAAGATAQQAMRSYYRWQVTILPQERYYTSIAVAGFLCLAASALAVRDRLGPDRAPARIGALLVAAGSLLWIAGSVLALGGHRAVGLMATHANPIQTTNSIAFTVDTIAAAFALAAFALIGAGMLGLAAAAPGPAHRAWARGTIVVALAVLVTAGSYAAGDDGFTDLMLLIGSAALLPLWLIWTGREAERHA
jgi:hypothetical protein